MKKFLFGILVGLLISACSSDSDSAASPASPVAPETQSTSDHPWAVKFGSQSIDLRDFVPTTAGGFDYFVNENDLTMGYLSLTPETEMLHLVPQSGGRWDLNAPRSSLDYGRRAFSYPYFHRASNRLYFVSDVKNNETYNVYRYEPKSGEIKIMTDLGYSGPFSISPDGRLIVIGRKQKLGPGAISCITAYSLEGGVGEPLVCDQKEDPSVALYSYSRPILSPSGLLVYVQVQNNQYEKQQVVILDTKSGKKDVIPAVFSDVNIIGFSGDTLRYLGKSSENRVGIYSYALNGTPPTKHYEGEVDYDAWASELSDPSRIAIEFSLPREKKGMLSLFNFTTGKLEKSIPSYEYGLQDPQWTNLQILQDGRLLLPFQARASLKKGVVAIKTDGAQMSVETVAEIAPAATAAKPCEFENIYYETFDKRKVAEKVGDQWIVKEVPRKIHAILFKPNQLPAAEKRAAFVSAHGGPSGSASSAWDADTQIFCHLGYHVLAANPRGSTGGGESDVKLDANGNVELNEKGEPVYQEFVRMNDDDWGGGDYSDYEMAIKYLEEKHGVPGNRVGIMGFSYGGYMTNWAVTRPAKGQIYKKFNFAISGASASDLKTAVETTVVPWALTGELGPYEGNEEKYRKSSPLRFAGEMNIPLLLFHGEQDNRLNFQQSKMFRDAIKAARPDADVELLVLPDEGHGVKYLVNHREKYRTIAKFLERVAPLD